MAGREGPHFRRRWPVATAVTRGPEATRRLARRVGARLQGGDRLLLVGPLGAGKTCFVQGLAQGLGVDPARRVVSQTFTLCGVYPGRLPLYHFDAYRLRDPAELIAWGDEALLGDDGVVAVEWGEGLGRLLPDPILWVRFRILSDQGRLIRFYGRAPRFEPLIAEIARARLGPDRGPAVGPGAGRPRPGASRSLPSPGEKLNPGG